MLAKENGKLVIAASFSWPRSLKKITRLHKLQSRFHIVDNVEFWLNIEFGAISARLLYGEMLARSSGCFINLSSGLPMYCHRYPG